MVGSYTVALTVALLAFTAVEAGVLPRYRNGYTPPARKEEDFSSSNHQPAKLLQSHRLPRKFDWCDPLDKGGLDLCTASWNQHIPQYCGACWAHGTLSALQDRIKIKKGGYGVDTMLSRQTMLNCGAFDDFGGGCDGGDPIDVFHYMHKYGLPDETCMLYSATDHTKYRVGGHFVDAGAKSCPAEGICTNCMPMNDTDTCWPVKTPILYTLNSYGKLKAPHGRVIDAMMSEIYANGPITCGVSCPEEFVYQYRGGIFRDTTNDTEIDHDVEVVGWGEDDDGTPYWNVRNSWGSFWGEAGFFRVERGVNALQIETGDCWIGDPGYKMEQDVDAGILGGSMYGTVEMPAQLQKPRHATRWRQLVKATRRATRAFLTLA